MSKYIIILAVYLFAANILSFATFGADKRRARTRQRRTPEAELLCLALIGGSVGALAGMLIFRHKTKHIKFILLIPLFTILHFAALTYFVAI